MGPRSPVFPTESLSLTPTRDTKLWAYAYTVSLLSVYITLKIWWEMVPSYTWMFYAWVIIIPFVMAAWARSEKKGLMFVALSSGFTAWMCDIFMLGIIDGDG